LFDWLAEMIEFFKNWIFRTVVNKHRLLFRYWDGSRYVSADPFVIFRALVNTEKFDPETDIKALQIPDPKIISKKISYIAEGVREIFNLKPFDQGGLAELECVNLLTQFSEFMNAVKKNGESNQISLPPMANPQAPVNDSQEQKSTNENSDCSSTVPESTL
jgi:hypothetical protein